MGLTIRLEQFSLQSIFKKPEGLILKKMYYEKILIAHPADDHFL